VEVVKICVGYVLEGEFSEILPVGAEELERCHPVYEDLPGWMESTVGVKSFERLPENAQAYLKRIAALAGVPIDLVSTGPEREETIVRRHPFDPAQRLSARLHGLVPFPGNPVSLQHRGRVLRAATTSFPARGSA